MTPQPAQSWSRPLALAAGGSLLLAAVLFVRAPSEWLRMVSPDGELNAGTARFLDSLRWWWAAAAVVALAAAARPDLRRTLAAAWTSAAPVLRSTGRTPALVCGAIAVLARLVLGAAGDPGLGDDGARVAWLLEWLQAPHLVWSGLWLPGHLYLHAFFWLVLRDAVWAGIVLSALASGGTTALLAHAAGRDWGRAAGWGAGIATAILPVSLAHGSTPDVNPVFTFLAVAAMAAAMHAGRWRGFVLAALASAWATWCRFDAIAIVPGVAAMLWPHRLRAIALAVVSLVPFVLWNVADMLRTGQAGHVAQVVQQDPTLRGAPLSLAFSFLGGLWQAAPLPCLLLGIAGAVRALRARRGRGWMLLALLHAGALAGTTVVFQAGTQPRYFILTGTIAAAYTGVALGGLFAASRRVAWSAVALGLVALVVAPLAYPVERDLWIRRDPRLRQLVDTVHALSPDHDIVWVAEESAYLYVCRIGIAIERYHGMPRADSDPALVLTRLDDARQATACVQQATLPLERWSRFETLAAPTWNIQFVREVSGYKIYALDRRDGGTPVREETR